MALLTGCFLTFCYKFLSVSTVLFVQKKYMCSKHFPVEHTRKLKIVVRLKPKLMGCLCIEIVVRYRDFGNLFSHAQTHAHVETNMADRSSDEYVPDESTLSALDSSDLSHDSASDYSSASEDSFSGSEDENDTVPMQIWSCLYPPEEDIDFLSFIVRNPGPRDMPAANSTPIVYFLLILTVEILGKIVTETKKYAAQFLGATDLSPKS